VISVLSVVERILDRRTAERAEERDRRRLRRAAAIALLLPPYTQAMRSKLSVSPVAAAPALAATALAAWLGLSTLIAIPNAVGATTTDAPPATPPATPPGGGDADPPLTHEDLGIDPPWIFADDDTPAAPPPKYGEPVRFYQVRIDDGFWRRVLDRNATVTVPTVWLVNERGGRFVNFETVRTPRGRAHRGRPQDDGDIFRVLDAAAWTLAATQDLRLQERLDGGVRRVVGAQRPDGYLSTWHQLRAPDRRFADMADGHELANLGLLMEAAATRYEVDGDRVLLDAARRAARLVMREFGPQGRHDVCGHPGIELGLIRLHEVLGDLALLETALWFVQQRGRTEGRQSLGERAQDHLPLLQQREVVGNPVGAMRLYDAAAELARLSGDEEMVAALEALWNDLVERRLDIVGGISIGPPHGHVADVNAIASDDAYAWISASIALAEWAHRMHLVTYDARYIDVMELALYNAILAGVSLDGDAFFEASPLASHGASRRSPWIDGGSSPTSLARHLASLRDRLFNRTQGTRAGNTLYVNHYFTGEVTGSFGRNTVRVVQRTDYPWDGRVQFWITGGQTRAYRIALRIPSWAESFTVLRDGQEVQVEIEKGYAILEGPWTPNQTAELRLEMPVRTLAADPSSADWGRIALARGPLIYCVEAVDSAPDLRRLTFDPNQEFTTIRREDAEDPVNGRINGMVSIAGVATRTTPDGDTEPVPFTAVPYFAWANRDPGAMLVWLPTRRELADPEPIGGITPTASAGSDRHPLVRLHDGVAPDPDDIASWRHSMPHFSWLPQRGTWEWVEFGFDAPRTITAVELFWVDDLARGGSHTVPRRVRLSKRGDADWVQVVETAITADARRGEFGHFSRLEFDAVTTDALRLEVQLGEGYSGGLLEWRVIEPDGQADGR